MLTERGNIQIRVFYTWGEGCQHNMFDPGFGKVISWDIPLLDGYDFEWVENVAAKPGSDHFNGIVNPSLPQQVDAYRPDAVLVYGWNFSSHLKLLQRRKKNYRLLFRGDSTLIDPSGKIRKMVRQIFLRWVYRSVDTALFVGTRNKEYFRSAGVSDRRLAFAPHCIDNQRFASNATYLEKAAALRKTLGIREEEVVFLFAGKLEPKKNPAILLQAFQQLVAANCHLVLVGNGILEAALKAAAVNMGNVHFLDFQNQQMMPVVYHMADVFVLPSSGPGETWGLAVNEAMAAGKAVIVSSNCGCAPDLVQENVNGFTFRSGRVDELRYKMQLLADKKTTEIFGKNSLELIGRFSFPHLCAAIEQAL